MARIILGCVNPNPDYKRPRERHDAEAGNSLPHGVRHSQASLPLSITVADDVGTGIITRTNNCQPGNDQSGEL